MANDIIEKINKLIPIKFNSKLDHSNSKFNHYKVTLKTKEGQATFTFFQGFGIKEDPTLDSVLYCLIGDAQAAIDFEGDPYRFMYEFGYDDKIEDAVYTLNKCKKIKDKLERLGILEHLEELYTVFENY
jgi:hypothetical protein